MHNEIHSSSRKPLANPSGNTALVAFQGYGYNTGRSILKTRKEHRETMHDSLVPSIERISPEEEPIVLPHLIHLLQDTVSSGASVGFLPPLSAEDAQQYWSTVFQEVAQGTSVLLVARDEDRIVGSVQLALALKPNARHRAEVQKLFVLSSQRRRGIGRALMQAVERVALSSGRTLLGVSG